MQYIVNATFTINVSRTDIGIIENIEFFTIQDVLEETRNELGMKIDEYAGIKLIHSKISKEKLKISYAKRRLLSSTDIKLLNASYIKKRNCILITDDRQVRMIAKEHNIRCYTTPQFIAYMIKKKLITSKDGITFLNKLKRIYIRPKDIETVSKEIKKWR